MKCQCQCCNPMMTFLIGALTALVILYLGKHLIVSP